MYLIGKEEILQIEELFLNKKFFRYQGKGVETNCLKFEREFADAVGAKYSLFVTSGTNALILALVSNGIAAGDEVIVPSYTFVATITAVLSVGAIPVIASVGVGLTLDIDQLAERITDKTKAIIAVHMDGLPCDMEQLITLARKHSLILIEDVAQAVGGSYKGKKLGSLGDAGCFSFNVDKIISCGEGGVVCFNDELSYKRALKLHDVPVSFGATHKDYLADLPPVVGHSMRMSEISAVIMREQLKRLDGILHDLQMRKKLILSLLAPISDILLFNVSIAGECGTHFHLKFSDPLTAADIARKLTIEGLSAVPLYARPAHCYWHWQHFIPTGSHLSTPFETKERLHLSNIVRIAVDFFATPESLNRQMHTLVSIVS